jgi:hypothetical protein
MNQTVTFLGPNFDDYEINFYVTALKHGKVGLDFIRSRWVQSKSDRNLLTNASDTEKTDNSASVYVSVSDSFKPATSQKYGLSANPDAFVGESNMSDRQNLFADMMFSISPAVYKRLRKRKFLRALIINVDHIGLWNELEEISLNWVADTERIQQENMRKEVTYGTFNGIKSMFSGDYVSESWKSNCDPLDLQTDIVTMTCNLALVGKS